MKTTTCKKCGTVGLVWRQSAKGNWYLSDPKTISTNTYGKHIVIPFAHNCEKVIKANEATAIEEKDTLRNIMISLHIGFEISPLQAELYPHLTEKYPEEVIAIKEWIANRQKELNK